MSVVDLVQCQLFIGRRNDEHAIIGGFRYYFSESQAAFLKVKNLYFVASEKGASKKFLIITVQ